MAHLTRAQLLSVLREDTYYALPHSVNAWLNSLKLKHSTKLVAQTLVAQVIIRSRNNDRLLIRLSKSLLSSITGVGIRTIPSCIKDLANLGIIKIHDTNEQGTLYEIFIDACCVNLIRPRKKNYMSQNGTDRQSSVPTKSRQSVNQYRVPNRDIGTSSHARCPDRVSQIGTEEPNNHKPHINTVEMSPCVPSWDSDTSNYLEPTQHTSRLKCDNGIHNKKGAVQVSQIETNGSCSEVSQIGTTIRNNADSIIDQAARELGFSSKERMFMALAKYRLGRISLDDELVSKIESIEEKMKGGHQTGTEDPHQYSSKSQSAGSVPNWDTGTSLQARSPCRVSQMGTYSSSCDLPSSSDRVSKGVSNWDRGGHARSVLDQIDKNAAAKGSSSTPEKKHMKSSQENHLSANSSISHTKKSGMTGVRLSRAQIKGVLTRMRKLSSKVPLWQEIALEIIWAIEKGKLGREGMTLHHRINAALKLVRENRWRTPAGFQAAEVGHAIFV